jgi:hypothetical protein
MDDPEKPQLTDEDIKSINDALFLCVLWLAALFLGGA